MTNDERLINKIRKIIALSGNNPSVEESQTALLKAQTLLAQHGLTMKQIENIEKPVKNVIDQPITPKQRTAWWHKSLALIIANNFRCYCYISRANQGTTINYLGLEEDIELAKDIYQYAVKMVEYHYKTYIKTISSQNTVGIKNNYIKGFLKGLNDKFIEQVERNNWGLILVKDNAVTKIYEQKNLKKGLRTKIQIRHDEQDWNEGYRRGKDFNYDDKQTKMIMQ